MFEKKTKWQVIVTYNQNGNDYIVFARKGVKSGMLYFKTKCVTPIHSSSYNFNPSFFDVKKRLEAVIYEID
jgi:hypothetical protein